MPRLAIAIEDDWLPEEVSVLVQLDDRISQAVFRNRRDLVLLYRHVPKTFLMFMGAGRVAGYSRAGPDQLIWRFDQLRRFPAPVISDAELDAPRVGRMVDLAEERALQIIEQGTNVAAEGLATQEAAAAFDASRAGAEIHLAVHDEVLRRWSYRCAITGRQFAPEGRPHPILQVVAIRPRALGGPLHAGNYLPMVAPAERAWRSGAIAAGPQFDILAVLDRLPPDLLEAMRPEGKLLVPDDQAFWPGAEHLAFHRTHIFGA
jgi:hypothetical protein